MKVLNKDTIEQLIITSLIKGSVPTVLLFEKVKENILCTKQGFYKALRNLKKEEVVVIHSKRVSLSYLWVKKQIDFYNSIIYKYNDKNITGEDFLILENGDSITYRFTNISAVDAFWIHILSILNQKVEEKEPMFIYNPHEWFLLARNESEISLFNNVKQIKRKLAVLVDNNNYLDNFVKKYFNSLENNYYISEKRIFKKDNYYLNIIGNYCIEVLIDKKTSALIDKFYKETLVFDEHAKQKIEKIAQIKGRNKFIISKNYERSEKLKKIFKKFFII